MRRCLMMFAVCLLAVPAGALVKPGGAQADRATGPCDRSCLETMAEQYLDALAAKDPKRLPIAPGAKYTENGQRLQVGDGVWNSISARGTYKLFVTDVTAGQVVAFAPDGNAYVVYGERSRQTNYVHDLPLLAEIEAEEA